MSNTAPKNEILHSLSAHPVGEIIASISTFIAIVISTQLIIKHHQRTHNEQYRKHIIRIVLMVPIYALESLLGLIMPQEAIYFDLARECYEALVIYSFFTLLVAVMGGEEQCCRKFICKKDVKHFFPISCLPPWKMAHIIQLEPELVNSEFCRHILKHDRQAASRSPNAWNHKKNGKSLLSDHVDEFQDSKASSIPAIHTCIESVAPSGNVSINLHAISELCATTLPLSAIPSESCLSCDCFCTASHLLEKMHQNDKRVLVQSDFLLHTQLGTLQYCVIKPVTAMLAFALQLDGLYDGNSALDYSSGYPYLAFINSLSQFWAMYCLILFYHVLRDELHHIRPLPKFICVKAVVFFTFWQSMFLVILKSYGVIGDSGDFSADNVQAGIQDFIVCIEMLFAAVAHHYAFPPEDFDDDANLTSHSKDLKQPLLNMLFEAVDVTDVFITDLKKIRQRVQGTHQMNPALVRQ